jgi:large subunit ribosomal protein L1
MIDISVCLNVDPRKPGQNLRGSLLLPNGSGKVIKVAVFSEDEDIIQQALQNGATLAGGESLLTRIAENYTKKGPSTDVASSLPNWDVSLASSGIMPVFHQLGLPRYLAPRNLFPNTKVGTLVQSPADLLPLLKERITGGTIMYKTDKEGVINLPVGKHSLGMDSILENGRAIMTHLFDVKPALYGRGKKKPSAKGKYIRMTYLSSTQARKSYRLDARVLDPSSPLFFDPFDINKIATTIDVKKSRREAELKKLQEESATPP